MLASISRPNRAAVSAFLVLCVGLPAASQADQFVVASDAVLSRAPLPGGSAQADLLPISQRILELTYLDEGELLAIREVLDEEQQTLGHVLARIEADGSVVDLGNIEPPVDVFGVESPADLAVDADGRLFMLSYVSTGWNPPDGYTRLVQLDASNGATVSNRALSKHAFMLARAPRGLWAQTDDGLEQLDPDTGQLTFIREFEPVANDGDTDASGALWLYAEGVCSPPCFLIHRFDPATGAVTNVTSRILNPSLVVIRDVTVKRECVSTATTLCVQGGRFQVEVTWRSFDDRRGPGKLTESKSADSGVFWFFDPANWELTVKVLDGCDLGGHYWVFASGMTNVEYTLTVTDRQTGAVRSYENSLGQTAISVTDTSAFACQ